MSARKSMGFMYLAKKSCGRISAACWDDAMSKKETGRLVAGYIRRGDSVERVERFEGDPMPDWICDPERTDCQCRLSSPKRKRP